MIDEAVAELTSAIDGLQEEVLVTDKSLRGNDSQSKSNQTICRKRIYQRV